MSRRRVVVTGLGCISPVGNTVRRGLGQPARRQAGIDRITRSMPEHFACKIAGEVKGFNVGDYMPAKEARHMDRFIHFGLAAACRRWHDSGLPTGDALDDELADAHRLQHRLGHRRPAADRGDAHANCVKPRPAPHLAVLRAGLDHQHDLGPCCRSSTASRARTSRSSRPAPPACTASARPAG